MKKIYYLLLIFFMIMIINPITVYAQGKYSMELNFTNKLGVNIINFKVNETDWNEWETGDNNIFDSDDDKYEITIMYANSTGYNPVILYDDSWNDKIEKSNFCMKGCIYSLTVDNSEHEKKLDFYLTTGFTVNFETNGGSSIDSKTIEMNKKNTKPEDPSKNGYAFDGWYQDETLNTLYDFNTPIIEDTILYAKWIEEYNIIVTTNDENMGFATTNTNKAIKGTKITLTAIPKKGYHFVRWQSQDIDASKGMFEMPNKDVNIKAIFEKNFKVSFDNNGGTGTMNDATDLIGTYILPQNEFTPPIGKKFKGWSLSQDGEIITELNIDEDKTIYAIWEISNNYSYEFKKGNNQTLVLKSIKNYTFTIDGDYSLFKSLQIGNLNLIKDEDYIVTEGSTIITFTKKGIEKLNALIQGKYKIIVSYLNGKKVTGTLKLTKELPPNTNIINIETTRNNHIIISFIPIFGLIGLSFYISKIIKKSKQK